MNEKLRGLEQERLALQAALDETRTRTERNRLGQFATPTPLARDILRYATGLLSRGEPLRFLDPAIGTGSFYSALRAVAPAGRIAEALGFEVDAGYGRGAREFWRREGLTLRIADFTRAKPDGRFNVVVCNPPYVRHHHLRGEEKRRLRLATERASGMSLSGLAGLYGHFLGLAHPWMADRGVAGWLIPSEFMDVNYGQAIKGYLLDQVTLLHIHRFDPTDAQFADALVSSAVVWFRKAPRPKDHDVRFTFGGSLLAPRIGRDVPGGALTPESKWTRLGATGAPGGSSRACRARRNAIQLPTAGAPTLATFFEIKRGIATGDNGYFILPESRITELKLPQEVLTPILPSSRYLPDDEVRPRQDGTPDVARRLFLLDIRLGEEAITGRYRSLASYLAQGSARGVPERYLCKHRTPWYRQEHRPAPPIVCTYLGRASARRSRPFRFILNQTRATVGNVYLALYPTALLASAIARSDALVRDIWQILNALTADRLLEQGRVYGGGLHKLEPRELAALRVPQIAALLRK